MSIPVCDCYSLTMDLSLIIKIAAEIAQMSFDKYHPGIISAREICQYFAIYWFDY